MSTAANDDLWKLRGDLQFHQIGGRQGDRGYWVVKDPFASDWLYVDDQEKGLLELADGKLTLSELCVSGIRSIAPSKASVDAMLSFYVHARRKGLLQAVGPTGTVDRATASASPRPAPHRWLTLPSKFLAFRFRGLNPNQIPSLPLAVRQAIPSKALVFLYGSVIALACTVLVSRFDQFSLEMAAAFAREGATWWLSVLIVIAFAKTLHEWAHIAAGRWVGAECRDIGVMLLLGTPCLYCDVSDLWTESKRDKRIFVSSAGMLAELLLAALATILWVVTFPSALHDLCLIIMVVCSVSTVIINANPLLRYDGYFMLSDWLEIPNLSQQANATLLYRVRRLLWGTATFLERPARFGRPVPTWWLLTYAILSLIYRTFIIMVIGLVIFHASERAGFGWIGFSFALWLGFAMIWKTAAALFRIPTPAPADADDAGRSDLERPESGAPSKRPLVVLSIVALALGSLLLLPLPTSLVLPVRITAKSEQDLYAVEGGRLVSIKDDGASVVPGDVLFRLDNAELQDQSARAEADLADAEELLYAWTVRKGSPAGSPTALAIAEKRVDAARALRDEAAERVENLTVRSRWTGRFTHALPPADHLWDNAYRPGQRIKRGTRCGGVGSANSREGYAYARQNQIDSIRSGMAVKLRHASISGGVSGTVIQVDRNALSRSGDRSAASPNPLQTEEPVYLVQIAFDEDENIGLALRSAAMIQIRTDPRSLWDRIRRLVSGEFRSL